MQKLQCNNVIHYSKKRLRIRLLSLNESVDVNILVSDFANVFPSFFISVMLNAKCISFSKIDDISEDEVNKICAYFNEYKLVKLKHKKEKPSKANIYASLLALANSYTSNPVLDKQASLLTSYPLLKEGLLDLVENGLTSHVLEAAAVAVSLLRKDYKAANSTNFMLNIGEYIEESAVLKSDDLVKELAKPQLTHAWVEENNELVKKSTDELKIGDIVVVSTGEAIAVDGYIVDGDANVNCVSMTGEANAVFKERGDRVLSSTIVEEGRIKIWAEAVGENTTTAKILHYMKDCLEEKSQIGKKAVNLANSLVPFTLSLAAIAYLFNGSSALASVLQADYSCALKLATPVAFKSAISYAGKRQILLKGSQVLERLSEVDTFVFDKTGTLTSGDLKVKAVYSFVKEYDEQSLLNLSASAEEHYFHPVAEAVVKAAKQNGFSHINHGEVEFIVAHGIKTSIDKEEVIIGSRHFLEDDEGVDFSKNEDKINELLNSGLTLLYIAKAKQLLGVIAMSDELRFNSKESILKLKQNGVKEVIMLTGDIYDRAISVANELGIDKVYAQLLPQDKAQITKKLKDEGRKIAFVGDGINDAPSLVQADVGISMQKGADIAKASADIALLKDDISCVVHAKILANETMKKIQKNFKSTVWINSAILLGAASGILNPSTTALAHNGTTIALLINSLKQNYKALN
ncbi:heavy metal translocating P-type ATPase [Campylobacter canadensis]|uniref:P-type Zn(2+) transporter n=1 Tax=Campylobacter canadensis TaxID=449520 RepID=A0ABS7WSC6_9BACT|nr:heavy metal translocating P-type ATPase [Campylobacter canadensis]MBZ7987661.1 heavy metal translocating P-type ATPase [Campylobacter canadensis]MBZ7995016.1 heavy metal translocating P-type ATPase [Campylobacter canadensis]MBZ7996958.1 heavy metal translocating P-type ATPase [Campylobacter canadensis]MBZ7998802.1 heavy metal translocating P-type ATPase [Campylobacter canadensis]MBZ8000437.1 heavy metal translocating P-type ATPase [Campylobacter canadensis]